ncbi:VWA domain-containing protein [Kitasatospora sp. NPDC088346]|uniref:VWA domain-containing protein n=1 Tax=Kitasatospora sp. NPDC088346 TaxID=3364073 RepID=UPI003804EFCB
MTVVLAKGANAQLPSGDCRVVVTVAGPAFDLFAVLLGKDGRVRGDHDLVFYNHPAQDGIAVAGDTVTADLRRLPGSVARVVVAAAAAFGPATAVGTAVRGGADVIEFPLPGLSDGETCVVLVEFYRRGDGWKVRAVGQGWASGAAGMATAYGLEVDEEPAPVEPPVQAVQAPQTARPVRPAEPPVLPAPASAPPTAPAAAPAISLDKVRRTAPGLVDLYKAAGVSLAKTGLGPLRAAVYLVLDHSASMTWFYENGTMQHLAEQALGLSANLDDDGTVPVVFFANGVLLVADLSLDAYQGRIDRLHERLEWGGTRFAPAMQAVIDHYEGSGATDPAFVIFQTDGEPFDRRATRELLRRSSSLPIFWQFVGFGHSRHLRFLRSLDTLGGRTIDNAGYFGAGQNPRARSNPDVYDRLMKEFPDWIRLARAAGIVR